MLSVESDEDLTGVGIGDVRTISGELKKEKKKRRTDVRSCAVGFRFTVSFHSLLWTEDKNVHARAQTRTHAALFPSRLAKKPDVEKEHDMSRDD